MDKNNWTYKKLGEVATIIGGSTPKSNVEEYWGGNHYWVTPADLNGNKYQGSTPRTITDLAIQKTNLQLLPIGTVLLSSRAPIGKVAITTVPMYCNQGFKNIVCSELLNNEFVYWYLLGKTEYLNSLGRGATFKEISKKTTEQIPIPIPPLAEQERIVAELDLLSRIIDKKKAQLKELDQLAQSIFYTMFGDPITNEKGWEVKRLREVSKLINGRAYKQKELLNEGKYKVLRVGNFFTNSNYYYSDLELEENKYCDNGDLLFAWSASFGAFIWDGEKVIYHYHIWKVLYDEKQLNKIFYCNLLNTMTNAFMNDVHGIGMVHLTKQGMEDYILPLPPLPLQQEFASKIEAIERQKSLIQQSIVETQTLFDSRMDHWFG